MINKRLLRTFPESMKFIKKNILFQWIGLLASVGASAILAFFIAQAFRGRPLHASILIPALIVCLLVRMICNDKAVQMSYRSSTLVKEKMRQKIFSKLVQIGPSYIDRFSTAEVVQLFSEGVDQLETYFGSYIPQFFYALFAPLTLFLITLFLNWKAALVLLICVPLIPASIIAVQKFAKKLLSKYWGEYTQLGDSFLENIQGLSTLKVYQADQKRYEEMNAEAENFRKITMRVLIMQLNSISIMDLVAYGGAAAGILVGLFAFSARQATLFQMLLIILISAEFFIPMRTLGSYFHIAMNGMAASDKMFKILDLPLDRDRKKHVSALKEITFDRVSFAYDEKPILQDLSLSIHKKEKVAIVGESGSGKSTMAKLLMAQLKPNKGEILWNETDLNEVTLESLYEQIAYLSHDSLLFKGTIKENVLVADPTADERAIWEALSKAGIADYFKSEQGLDTLILENGSNFSGGQKQRIALARLLLKPCSVYLLDEATSNVDVETEEKINEVIDRMQEKTIIRISHRLKNIMNADRIFVLANGRLVEQGKHEILLKQNGEYARLWNAQQELEAYNGGVVYENE